jgi:hypothetical protein
VLLPFGQNRPYDLVIHVRGALFLRVQCKSARFDRGRALFNGYGTDHGQGVTRYYGLADLYGVHFGALDAVYLVPVHEVTAHHGRLRIEPARNRQRHGVRMAAGYEIDLWTEDRLVALASSVCGHEGNRDARLAHGIAPPSAEPSA